MNPLPTVVRLVQLAVLVLASYIAIRALTTGFAGTDLAFDIDDLAPFGAMLLGAAIVGLILSVRRSYDDR